jgi:hypothetical protein
VELEPTGPIVLSLCDRTGIMVRPWAEAGFECWCVDRQHTPGVRRRAGKLNIVNIGADIRYWLPPRVEYAIAFAFPPCTHLANSGARWFKPKGLGSLLDALELVERCRAICEWLACPWMVENPVGTLSTYWRKPDFTFDPWQFSGYLAAPEADWYTKRTCLWVGNGMVLPKPLSGRTQKPLASRIHLMPQSARRSDERSKTPLGFARAVFQANGCSTKLRTGAEEKTTIDR